MSAASQSRSISRLSGGWRHEHQSRQQIENLKISHPELIEDDEAWLASLESETDFNECLPTIVRRIEDTKALVIGTKDRFEELKARKDRFEHRIEACANWPSRSWSGRTRQGRTARGHAISSRRAAAARWRCRSQPLAGFALQDFPRP
jgi:hypothetical protein